MFAFNAVDPANSTRITYVDTVGAHSHVTRDDERGPLDAVRLLGLVALLVLAYVAGGIATATPAAAPIPVEQDGGIGGPAAKQGGAVATPVVGEFRLGPGNNEAPGLVTAPVAPVMPVATPVVGEFRLGPGNNEAPGLVAAPAGVALPDDLHAGDGGTMGADQLLPFTSGD